MTLTTTPLPTSIDSAPMQTPVFLYMPVPLVRGVVSDPLTGVTAGVFPARVTGYRLYRAAMWGTGADPMGFVAAQIGHTTLGRLYVIHSAQYARVLEALDRAFGFRYGDPSSLYARRRVSIDWVVDDAAVAVHAWMYEGGTLLGSSTHMCTPVPEGNWSNWLTESHAYRSGGPRPDEPVTP